jgi:hypothetical protein
MGPKIGADAVESSHLSAEQAPDGLNRAAAVARICPSRNLISAGIRFPHERRAGQLQCPNHGEVVGDSRPTARQTAAVGTASDASAASAQPLLDLGLLREVFAPRANGPGAAHNSMGRRNIE